ncbi:MAG: hypothetical protein Q6L60_12395 [Thermostichus sp. HHBFW_bins_43]
MKNTQLKISQGWIPLHEIEVTAAASQAASSPFRATLQLLWSGLKHTWQALTNFWVGSDEVQVWQSRDRAGHVLWHAYDPKTNTSATICSEDELRCWIEERYYHPGINRLIP